MDTDEASVIVGVRLEATFTLERIHGSWISAPNGTTRVASRRVNLVLEGATSELASLSIHDSLEVAAHLGHSLSPVARVASEVTLRMSNGFSSGSTNLRNEVIIVDF